MMHTEIYCRNLEALDNVKAIRAIHEAFLQLSALGERVDGEDCTYDNAPAIKALADVLADVGHIGFSKESA